MAHGPRYYGVTIPDTQAGSQLPMKGYAVFKANEAIAVGAIVTLVGTDGYTVENCDAADETIHGVATAAVAADAYGLFQTKGFCDIIRTDNSVADNSIIISGTTAGVADGVALGSADALEVWAGAGESLAADTDNGYATDIGKLSAAWLDCQGS